MGWDRSIRWSCAACGCNHRITHHARPRSISAASHPIHHQTDNRQSTAGRARPAAPDASSRRRRAPRRPTDRSENRDDDRWLIMRPLQLVACYCYGCWPDGSSVQFAAARLTRRCIHRPIARGTRGGVRTVGERDSTTAPLHPASVRVPVAG
jgi:hypothetical protein